MQKTMRFFSAQRSRKILSIAIPSGLNSLLDIINLSIDLLMIGTLGVASIVAVGVSLNFIMMIFAFTAIIFVGNSALVARFLGAGDKIAANSVVASLSLAAFCLSFPLLFIAFFSYEFYFLWVGISKDAEILASAYLQVALFSIPFLMVRQVSISAFSAAGATKIPFFIKIFITTFNPFLKGALIFGFLNLPAFGVVGAAIGSLVINILETSALLLILIFYKKSPVCLRGSFSFDYIKRALKVGIPSGVERFCSLFAIVLMTKFIANYGTYELGGYQIATRLEGFAFMPGFGFMIAAMALMGQNLGAKKPLEARYCVLNTLLLGGAFMGVVGILMAVFAPFISSFFSSEAQAIAASVSYLVPVGISQIAFAFICILDGALRGAGVTKIPLIVNAFMIWVVRMVPCYFMVTCGLPAVYIYICIAAETFLRAFVFWKIFQRGAWKRKKV